MIYTKNKNNLKRKRKRKSKTIKKSKRKFIGGTNITNFDDFTNFLEQNKDNTGLKDDEIQKLINYYIDSQGFTLNEIDDNNGGTTNIQNALNAMFENVDDSGRLNQKSSPQQQNRQLLYEELKEKIPAINLLISRKIHRKENIIAYDDTHFHPIPTEGRENKCLYFAYVRSKIGDSEFHSDKLFHQIREINDLVHRYMEEHAIEQGYTQANIDLAHPSSDEYQEDAQLSGLVNATNSIILVKESKQTNPAVKGEHFNMFYPVRKSEEEYNRMQIIFMKNERRVHFTALIPKTLEIENYYKTQVLDDILRTEQGRKEIEARQQANSGQQAQAKTTKDFNLTTITISHQ